MEISCFVHLFSPNKNWKCGGAIIICASSKEEAMRIAEHEFDPNIFDECSKQHWKWENSFELAKPREKGIVHINAYFNMKKGSHANY